MIGVMRAMWPWIDNIDVKSLMMSNFQYKKRNLVNQESRVLFHGDHQIFSDAHQADFASTRPSQHLEI